MKFLLTALPRYNGRRGKSSRFNSTVLNERVETNHIEQTGVLNPLFQQQMNVSLSLSLPTMAFRLVFESWPLQFQLDVSTCRKRGIFIYFFSTTFLPFIILLIIHLNNEILKSVVNPYPCTKSLLYLQIICTPDYSEWQYSALQHSRGTYVLASAYCSFNLRR